MCRLQYGVRTHATGELWDTPPDQSPGLEWESLFEGTIATDGTLNVWELTSGPIAPSLRLAPGPCRIRAWRLIIDPAATPPTYPGPPWEEWLFQVAEVSDGSQGRNAKLADLNSTECQAVAGTLSPTAVAAFRARGAAAAEPAPFGVRPAGGSGVMVPLSAVGASSAVVAGCSVASATGPAQE
jgi:hypothetical protein